MIGFELQKMYIDISNRWQVNRDKIKKVQIESKCIGKEEQNKGEWTGYGRKRQRKTE